MSISSFLCRTTIALLAIGYTGLATATPDNSVRFNDLFYHGFAGTSAGSYTMTNDGTMHFLEAYFYSDNSCSTLIADGMMSFGDNAGTGLALTTGETYSLNAQSIYKSIENRGLTPGDVKCMKVFIDGGHQSSDGISCMTFEENCADGACTTTSPTASATWAADSTVCVTRHAYVATNDSNQIYKCNIDNDTGALSGCDPTETVPATPGNVFDNGYEYFSAGNNGVYRCTVNPADSGALTNCELLITGLGLARTMTIDGAHGYIGGTSPSGNSVQLCSFVNGTIDACGSTTGSGFVKVRGITLYNGHAYIADDGSGGFISSCGVDSDDTFTGCSTVNVADAYTRNPRNITVYQGRLYFVNTNPLDDIGAVTSCAISTEDGALSDCKNATSGEDDNFSNPIGITIYRGYAYITNGGAGTLTYCTVDTANGTLSNCASTGSFGSATSESSVAIY